MADLTPLLLSQMATLATLSGSALLYLAPEDSGNVSGYASNKMEVSAFVTGALAGLSLPLVFTKTEAKTAAGAINELAPTKLTTTLSSGSTSVTLSDASITTTCTLKFYSETWGLYPSQEPAVTTGSVTLTFDAQETDANIKVEVYQ